MVVGSLSRFEPGTRLKRYPTLTYSVCPGGHSVDC